MPGRPSRKYFAILGILSLVFYAGLSALGNLREHVTLYLALHGALFLIYAVGIRGCVARGDVRGTETRPRLISSEGILREGVGPGVATRWRVSPEGVVLLFAVAFRLVLVPTPPSLSDDLHRYVWDGRVQTYGINPYRYAPAADELRELRDEAWTHVNHPEISTIYPPFAEGFYFAMAAVGLREVGFKAVLCGLDVGVILLLMRLLRKRGAPTVLAIVYAWNPLVIVEVASSGHVEPLGLILVILAVLLTRDLTHERGVGETDRLARSILRRRRASDAERPSVGPHDDVGRPWTLAGSPSGPESKPRFGSMSALSWGASVLARWIPLVFLPIFAKKWRWSHVATGALLIAVGFLPYAGAGKRLVAGLDTYAENWDYNSIVFPVVRAIFEAVLPYESLVSWVRTVKNAMGDPEWCQVLDRVVWPASIARIFLAAVLVGIVLWIARRVADTARAIFLASAWLLVLSPTLHPWYLLWILPFAAIERSWTWIFLTGLAPLAYLSLGAADGRVPLLILILEWGLPAGLAMARGVTRAGPSPNDSSISSL